MTETRQPRSTTVREQPGATGRAAVPEPRAGETAPQVQVPRTITVRLPLVTITIGPQPGGPATASATPAPTAASAPTQPGGTLQKAVFYGGVAAAGALGAIEWPVAVAVAAGTWVAQHTAPVAGRLTGRPAPRPMAQGEPAGPSPDPDAAGG
ncbi:hypothetical protein ACI782_14030 [Geodermatophilus sp. SYSU D00703]